jgi:hypothetical protein
VGEIENAANILFAEVLPRGCDDLTVFVVEVNLDPAFFFELL